MLDKVNEFGKVKPLAAAKLSLKLQVALQELERVTAIRAHDRDEVPWAEISKTMGMSSRNWAWERYHSDPVKRKAQRANLVANAVAYKHLRDDNLMTLNAVENSACATPEKPPTEMEE